MSTTKKDKNKNEMEDKDKTRLEEIICQIANFSDTSGKFEYGTLKIRVLGAEALKLWNKIKKNKKEQNNEKASK